MKEAILFPGQGAQFPGMGRDWVEARPTAAKVFQDADEILGFSLSEACWSEHSWSSWANSVALPKSTRAAVATTGPTR